MGITSNPPQASTSKISNSSAQSSTSVVPQSGPSVGVDSAQRRAGSSGSFGSGANSRHSGTVPRGKQGSRNQHKQSKRFRYADEDAFAESAAMGVFTNKKGQTSITHLMNFSLPPRPSYRDHYGYGHRNTRRNPTWGLGSGYHAIDKARYVHANYRFVVDPRKDYEAQSVDADVYLDWNSILQVVASPQSQSTSCPICLGEPTASRMAKCGHIFCLHCLIRYMHSTDDTDHFPEKKPRWKKCPICEDSIYISEARPVRWYVGQEAPTPMEGGDIVLRLVMRPAASTLALPKDTSPVEAGEHIPWHFAADVMDYARVMKGSEDYMIEQFDEELVAIQQLEKHDELVFGEDTEWTSRAMRAVRDSKDKAKGIGNPPKHDQKRETAKPERKPIHFTSDSDAIPPMYEIQHEARSGHSLSTGNHPQPVSGTSTDIDSSTLEEASARSKALPFEGKTSNLATSLAQFKAAQHHQQHHPPTDYFFYQALLHHYLSPLDIRILKAAFGNFSAFPSTILPRVERISSGHVVDDDLRKRTKYLSHLPRGCEVSFLECNWTDTVPPEILEQFKPEIERRRKRNTEKATREEKERARAEKEEEDKRYASARRIKQSSAPVDRFQPEDFQPLGAVEVGGSPEAVEGGGKAMSPMWTERRMNGSSFATLASPSTSPSQSRTVWGTAAIAPSSPELSALTTDHGPVDDGWLQGWEKELAQEDELIAQVAAASLKGESSRAPVLPVGGGKKKKGKKITLMSTNARRAA